MFTLRKGTIMEGSKLPYRVWATCTTTPAVSTIVTHGHLTAASAATATIRSHTAFPTTAGGIGTLGTALAPGAMIRPVSATKLWCTSSATVSAATFRVHRLE